MIDMFPLWFLMMLPFLVGVLIGMLIVILNFEKM